METLDKSLLKRRSHTLEELKNDMRDLKRNVDERFRQLEAKMESRFSAFESTMRIEFRLLWAANFALAGLLAKGFHWF